MSGGIRKALSRRNIDDRRIVFVSRNAWVCKSWSCAETGRRGEGRRSTTVDGSLSERDVESMRSLPTWRGGGGGQVSGECPEVSDKLLRLVVELNRVSC